MSLNPQRSAISWGEGNFQGFLSLTPILTFGMTTRMVFQTASGVTLFETAYYVRTRNKFWTDAPKKKQCGQHKWSDPCRESRQRNSKCPMSTMVGLFWHKQPLAGSRCGQVLTKAVAGWYICNGSWVDSKRKDGGRHQRGIWAFGSQKQILEVPFV